MDIFKELTGRFEKQSDLLKATETDRDAWKELAQKAEEKLVMLRHVLREALETSE